MLKGHAGKKRVELSRKERGRNIVGENQETVELSRKERGRNRAGQHKQTVIDSGRVHHGDGIHLAKLGIVQQRVGGHHGAGYQHKQKKAKVVEQARSIEVKESKRLNKLRKVQPPQGEDQQSQNSDDPTQAENRPEAEEISNGAEDPIEQFDGNEEAKKLQLIIDKLGTSDQENLNTKGNTKESVRITNKVVDTQRHSKVR
eukprot:14674441-Heterocapsa_arctica.AAC.2